MDACSAERSMNNTKLAQSNKQTLMTSKLRKFGMQVSLKLSSDYTHLNLSSGQEEPSRSKIGQNWDFFRYVLFGTGQSISKAYFDLIATKNVKNAV